MIKKQKTRTKNQKTRSKKQEPRNKKQEPKNKKQEPRTQKQIIRTRIKKKKNFKVASSELRAPFPLKGVQQAPFRGEGGGQTIPCQISTSRSIPMMILYTPQTRKPYFFRKLIKNLMANSDTINAVKLPMLNNFI
jgi:hypothetical protein